MIIEMKLPTKRSQCACVICHIVMPRRAQLPHAGHVTQANIGAVTKRRGVKEFRNDQIKTPECLRLEEKKLIYVGKHAFISEK